METIFTVLSAVLDHQDPLGDLVNRRPALPPGAPVYMDSIHRLKNSVLLMARDEVDKFLVELAKSPGDLDPDFAGESTVYEGLVGRRIDLTHDAAEVVRAKASWTAPSSLRKRTTTIGLGDRLGMATPGQLAAVRQFKCAPVLAQQSIRELNLTGRTFHDVVDDCTFLVFQAGYTNGYGADGDHLKTIAEIDQAVDAGMTMITLDQTGVMNAAAADLSDAEIETAFAGLGAERRKAVIARYGDQTYSFHGRQITISALEAKRCAVMYDPALEFTCEVWQHLCNRCGSNFDLELSIDETTTPTLPSHHLFITAELQYRGVKLNSLAPRFVGDFQKGIDYIGDLTELDDHLRLHCSIARFYGNYKISVHSGSDKFSAYPLIGRHTRGRMHLKTSGTSWLEALRVIAREEPDLFRDLHAAAVAGTGEMLKLYHITADFDAVPNIELMSDHELPRMLEDDNARQMLHIAYGTLLGDRVMSVRIKAAVHEHEEAYYKFLERHFVHHLEELGISQR